MFLLQLLGPYQLGSDVVDSEQPLPEPKESSTEPDRTAMHQQENVHLRESFVGGTNLRLLEPTQPLVRVTMCVCFGNCNHKCLHFIVVYSESDASEIIGW